MKTNDYRLAYWTDNFLSLIKNQRAVFILMSLAVILVMPGLGQGSLRDWDEAIYSQVSREMIQNRDWINLYHGYEPYYEKPPLYMWIMATFFRMFGVNEFLARLPSAISGLLLIWVTYLIGAELFDKRTGFLAGLILLGSNIFVREARNGTTNMMLTLFIFTGTYSFIQIRRGNTKWWYMVMGSCALAFMVKFWAALVLPAIVAIILLWEKGVRETLQNRYFWGGILLALLIVVPWHVLAYINNGQSFVTAYINRNLVERTLTSLEGHVGTSTFYLDTLRQHFSPWFFLLPFALVLGFRETIINKNKVNILIIIVLLTFGFYTFIVNTKIYHYILPIYPALAILVAYLFTRVFSASEPDIFLWVCTGMLMATTVIQDKLLILSMSIGILGAILVKVGLFQKTQAFKFLAGLIFVTCLISGVLNSFLGNHRLQIETIYGYQITPIARIATLAGQVNPSRTASIIGLAIYEPNAPAHSLIEGPTAIFYSNRPVRVALTLDQLEQMMNEQESGEIIVAEVYLERLIDDFEILIIEKISPLVYAKFNR